MMVSIAPNVSPQGHSSCATAVSNRLLNTVNRIYQLYICVSRVAGEVVLLTLATSLNLLKQHYGTGTPYFPTHEFIPQQLSTGSNCTD